MSWDYLTDLRNVPGLTPDEVLTHLNVDDVGDVNEGTYIQMQLVPAAYSACEAFCNRNVFPLASVWDIYEERAQNPDDYHPSERVGPAREPMVANRVFVQAVLLTVGHFYRNRESTTAERMMELPLGARSVLWPLRKNLGV